MADTIALVIKRPGKDPDRFSVEPGVYTIGRDEDCAIQLSHDDVEPRHAILTLRVQGHAVEDLDSRSGTYVAGQPVQGHCDVADGSPIGIGPFTILVNPDTIRTTAASVPATPAANAWQQAPASPAETEPPPPLHVTQPPPIDPDLQRRRSIKQQIHKELVTRLDIKRLSASRIQKEELRVRARGTIETIVQDVRDRLPPGVRPEDIVREVFDEAMGLGPLETFLADPDVSEIMVNGPNQIYVEKGGRLVKTRQTFMDDSSVLAIIERIVSPIGRRIDESQPYVDARLPDGSRVNAIIHPLSLVGPCLTIRKFSERPFTDEDLIRFGTLTPAVAHFARRCVALRKNIVVSGGTGSGKTTLLNVLSGYIPDGERIVTIEDAAELRLAQTHVVRLEARPPNIEGKGAVSIRDLVRNSLRMRPDRIVVGECRGGEALDMLQAMNTGHDGSLTTVHANSPRDVVSRLETMVLMALERWSR
jgi:pilus assembly protein CpaF